MVRITHSYEEAKDVVYVWAGRCKRMAVYEHIGDITEKVHIHLCMDGCEVEKKQLRELGARTGLDLKGNAMCSMKVWDGEERPLVYMTKGKFEPKYLQGFTTDDHLRWKSLWTEPECRSKDGQIYDHYMFDVDERYMYYTKDNPINANNVLTHKFDFIKAHAKSCAFQHMKCVWNIQAVNLFKMLVYTFCFRSGVVIPKNDAVFKTF